MTRRGKTRNQVQDAAQQPRRVRLPGFLIEEEIGLCHGDQALRWVRQARRSSQPMAALLALVFYERRWSRMEMTPITLNSKI